MAKSINLGFVAGYVHAILPINQYNVSDFVLRAVEYRYDKESKMNKEFVVYVTISVFNYMRDVINGLKEGDFVSVKYSPKSRESNGRWYTSLILEEMVCPTYSTKTANQNKFEKQQRDVPDDVMPF